MKRVISTICLLSVVFGVCKTAKADTPSKEIVRIGTAIVIGAAVGAGAHIVIGSIGIAGMGSAIGLYLPEFMYIGAASGGAVYCCYLWVRQNGPGVVYTVYRWTKGVVVKVGTVGCSAYRWSKKKLGTVGYSVYQWSVKGEPRG